MRQRIPDGDSSAYYDANAEAFCEATLAVEMSPFYARFLARVPPGGRILDAGCGSGRDALAFRVRGFEVVAFDASAALARLAAEHCGLPVEVLRFQDLDWRDRFDGIWACASLLHVPAAELPEVLHRLARALKPGGVLYASFKYGQGERHHDQRRFTDLDEAGLGALLREVPAFAELDTWVTRDRRAERSHERWLNTLLMAGGSPKGS